MGGEQTFKHNFPLRTFSAEFENVEASKILLISLPLLVPSLASPAINILGKWHPDHIYKITTFTTFNSYQIWSG